MRFLLVFLLCLPLYAQQATLINSSNSILPEDDIWSITIDTSDTVWVGTAHSGITIFNDENITLINKNNSPVTGEYITPLFTDSHNRVWVSYSNPTALFLYDNGIWVQVTDELLIDSSIIDITQDTKGNVYFGCDGSLVKYDGKKYSSINLSQKTIIRSIDVSAEGVFAIGHNEGLMVGTEGKWEEYTDENSELQLSTVRGVQFMPDGGLIIGYGGGMGKGGFSILKNNTWQHYNKNNSNLEDQMVRDIEPDSMGNYWMATNNGLSRYKDGAVETYMFREGKYSNVIIDIAISGNIVWVATNFGVIKMEIK